jgi:hypothetical protein
MDIKTRSMIEAKQILPELERNRVEAADLQAKGIRNGVAKMQNDFMMLRIEADVQIKCCQAIDEHGKPLYGNETLRKAIINQNLSENEEYMKRFRRSLSLKRREARLKNLYYVTDAKVRTFDRMVEILLADTVREATNG